jgi:hypothetical protein
MLFILSQILGHPCSKSNPPGLSWEFLANLSHLGGSDPTNTTTYPKCALILQTFPGIYFIVSIITQMHRKERFAIKLLPKCKSTDAKMCKQFQLRCQKSSFGPALFYSSQIYSTLHKSSAEFTRDLSRTCKVHPTLRCPKYQNIRRVQYIPVKYPLHSHVQDLSMKCTHLSPIQDLLVKYPLHSMFRSCQELPRKCTHPSAVNMVPTC